jgi:phosphate/sulfate permease
VGDDRPPNWVRSLLVATCGGVSFAHGSNDGQKGMGLILLVLIGFLPAHYALNTNRPTQAQAVLAAVPAVREWSASRTDGAPALTADLDYLERALDHKASFNELSQDRRWEVRQAIFRTARALKEARAPAELRKPFTEAIEFVPLWVVVGVALALGVGTTVGYQRIVVTVAEKIGKTHLTYAQGAAAEVVAAATIMLADLAHAPVSTTQVVSSGVAGTMVANGSGVQGGTCKKILLAWVLTLPGTILLAGGLFAVGQWVVG